MLLLYVVDLIRKTSSETKQQAMVCQKGLVESPILGGTRPVKDRWTSAARTATLSRWELLEEFPVKDIGDDLFCYPRCMFKRDKVKGVLKMTKLVFADSLVEHFDI